MYQSPPPNMPSSKNPLGRRWMAATWSAGMLAGLLGFARYAFVCRAICGPTQRGIFSFTPGYTESVLAGCLVAGPLCALLVLFVQSRLLRPYVQAPVWFLLGLPAAGLTTLATVFMVAANAQPTDFRSDAELIIPLIALLFILGAGAFLATATGRAIGRSGLESWAWRRASIGAWLQGWVMIALGGALGGPLLAVLFWPLCWGIVGLRTGREVGLLMVAAPLSGGEEET